METLGTILLVVAATALALYLGRAVAEVVPQLLPVLDRKPFNCRPCATFHLTWIFIALVAGCVGSLAILLMGVGIAFVLFVGVRHIENKKIVE